MHNVSFLRTVDSSFFVHITLPGDVLIRGMWILKRGSVIENTAASRASSYDSTIRLEVSWKQSITGASRVFAICYREPVVH